MRINHNILVANFLRNLNAISNRLELTQQQLATGRKYNKPSHGPVEVGQIIGFKSSLAHFAQYLKNVDDGSSQVGYIDTIMQAVINDLGRSRDLALDGANDNLNEADRRAIGQEVNLILDSTLSNSNTKFRDRYTFAGWETRAIPFEGVYNPRTGFLEDVIYRGDRGKIDRLVGDGDRLTVNVSGKEVFLEQTYTLRGNVFASYVPLGFDGRITINNRDFIITKAMTMQQIALMLNSASGETSVFAYVDDGRIVLESTTAASQFILSDDQNNILLDNLGIYVSGAFNTGFRSPTLPIVDSTPAIFNGVAPVVFPLAIDSTNNIMNVFLGADANGGISKAANIFITPGNYNNIGEIITELQSQINKEYGPDRLLVSDPGGGILQIETVATGDEINFGDLFIGGQFNGYDDTASGLGVLNLIAGPGPVFAGTAGTDGNDKIIIDLGPTASKTGIDVGPQTIDLRAGTIATVDDLIAEIEYQIFNNDALRGAVDVWLNAYGRIHFETTNQGAGVLAIDFQFSEGATGTLDALGISSIPIQAVVQQDPDPIPPFPTFPMIIVPGLNDLLTIDLGPTISVDGTDPGPVTLSLAPFGPVIYNTITDMRDALLNLFSSNPILSGALDLNIIGAPPNAYLELSSVNSGSGIRGEDLNISGTIVDTLDWLPGDALAGGGTSDGRGVELEPRNIFHTMMSLRDDCMAGVGLNTEILNAMNENRELLGLAEGDIVTVNYDAGSFTFRIISPDIFEEFVEYIQDIFGTRALVNLTSDGRIQIENLETFNIIDVSITAESSSGIPRNLFNDIFSVLPDEIPGLTKVTSKFMTDPTRYRRLGDEDLGLMDMDLENLLKTEAIVGARANRLTTINNLFSISSLNVAELKNTIEAANYAEVLTYASQQELILQSALGVGARVLLPSLLDFLM